MKNAIVCLTRGYQNRFGYRDLLTRNRCIFDTINSDRKYPLIIFHEGNISDAHQKYIRENSNGQEIKFVNVSNVWDAEKGYESMCRFNSYWLWFVLRDMGYEYALRIDEDCHIMKLDADPFDMIGNNVYLKSCYFEESHSETNATLPGAIELITGVEPSVFYNGKFPYTNISLSSVDFWMTNPVHGVLRSISLNPAQMQNRWGDLPILGSLLNIYAEGLVGTIEGLKYYHHSHDLTIDSH